MAQSKQRLGINGLLILIAFSVFSSAIGMGVFLIRHFQQIKQTSYGEDDQAQQEEIPTGTVRLDFMQEPGRLVVGGTYLFKKARTVEKPIGTVQINRHNLPQEYLMELPVGVYQLVPLGEIECLDPRDFSTIACVFDTTLPYHFSVVPGRTVTVSIVTRDRLNLCGSANKMCDSLGEVCRGFDGRPQDCFKRCGVQYGECDNSQQLHRCVTIDGAEFCVPAGFISHN